MRPITQPPPKSRCEQCGGELRLKRTETADRRLDLEYEIFVCANCGREQSLVVRNAFVVEVWRAERWHASRDEYLHLHHKELLLGLRRIGRSSAHCFEKP
jgi:hypothetical protein